MLPIRPEQPADNAAIHTLNAACFPTDAEARLVDLLRAAGSLAVSLVAEDDGAIVGHIAFSPVTTASGEIGIGLAPLAVAEAQRRRGIAAELVRAGLQVCRERGYGWAVVLGEPKYYGRFGFRAAPALGLADEYGGGDAFQVLELSPGKLPINGGLVKYAPEFSSLE
jgi:putative acetyltransferase